MHWIDLLLAIPLAWGFYKGVTRGFVSEVVALAAFIIAIYLSLKASDLVAGKLADSFGMDSPFLPILSTVIIFVTVMLAGMLTGRLLTLLVSAVALGLLNRVAGAVFGVARMLLLLCVILFMIDLADQHLHIIPDALKAESLLYRPLTGLAESLIPAVADHEAFDTAGIQLP